MDERLPIIVGAGQVTQRPETERPVEPLALMAEAARAAEKDAGVAGLLQELDSIRVINHLSWPSKDPPRDLAKALGTNPREALYTHVGGNTPQWQINEAAEAIHGGAADVVLIAGAEAMYSVRRMRTKGIDLGWSPRGKPEPDVGDGRPGSHEVELRHGATVPTSIYPLFENAIRAHAGRAPDEHRMYLGRLFEPFSRTAAQNPYAWFRTPRTASEIATPTPENRYIGYPYTKYMNAIMDVDQGAALIVTSVEAARRLGIDESRWVYLWGCGDATDRWFVKDRVNYYSSPAIRACTARAFEMAGVGAGDIAYFDLYSCFPSAVQIARDMIGLSEDDPRPLTVCGGLPYFGGPGNNYVSHSVAAMVSRLRADRGKLGMVTANGWYVTKHSCGIYSTDPPRQAWRRADPKADQAKIDAEVAPEFVEMADGEATVETYTVLFDRDGAPQRGIVIGRDAAGRRFFANTPPQRSLLESMTRQEFVGAHGRVSAGPDNTNVFVPG